MSEYSITVTTNEPSEITAEVEQKFKNRNKWSSKRLGDLIKSTFPIELSPFKLSNKQSNHSNSKLSKQLNLSNVHIKDSNKKSKNYKVEEKTDMQVRNNKVSELESLLNYCMINDLEFEEAFDKVIDSGLLNVNNLNHIKKED